MSYIFLIAAFLLTLITINELVANRKTSSVGLWLIILGLVFIIVGIYCFSIFAFITLIK
jgi:hypothetical protein